MSSAAGRDAQLVARCLDGQEGAWQELVERHARYVYMVASRHRRLTSHDVEDVFQGMLASSISRCLAQLRVELEGRKTPLLASS